MGLFDPIIKPFKMIVDAVKAIIDFICKCKLIINWFSATMTSLFCYIKVILFCPLQYMIMWFFTFIFSIIRSIIHFCLTRMGLCDMGDYLSAYDKGVEIFFKGYKSFFGECFVCKPFNPFPF